MAAVLSVLCVLVLLLVLLNRLAQRIFEEVDNRDDAVRRGIRDAVGPMRTKISLLEQALYRLQREREAGGANDASTDSAQGHAKSETSE